MTIETGAKLGRYEIRSQLGAGGMGVVYRARDSQLGRDVAIKVLPASFSVDQDRLRRFEQEACAASALNHPNILVVHDIAADDGTPYVVSELLEEKHFASVLVGLRWANGARWITRCRLRMAWQRPMRRESSIVISNRTTSSSRMMDE
jgi:serine/threonine protein kinase